MPSSRAHAIVVMIALCASATACRDGKTQPSPPKFDADPREALHHRVPAGHPLDPADLPTVDHDKDEYVPAEFKAGADRWKDPTVYVDGKPIGVVAWGELPLTLQPTWIEVRKSANKRYGHPEDKGWVMSKERYYKFSEYLQALGIDLKKVKEVHVYAAKFSGSVVATGKQLRSKAAERFGFKFGMIVKGKPIPLVPGGFANGASPDALHGVMVYIDKKPPAFEKNVGFFLDGKEQTGVPYYGEPLRGGVRVYLDDKMVAYIKRQELPVATSVLDAQGQPSWKLYDVLAGQGVATDAIVEAWVIRHDKREERIGAEELPTLMFSAGAQASKSSSSTGSILLGPNHYAARAIALHTKPVDPATFPHVEPFELE